MAKQYWLMKTEPSAYSIDNLQRKKTDSWDGVRNYQARNFMQQMSVGDMVLFYHSSCEPAGVAGLARVSALAHPDQSQFDPKDEHFDPKSKKENPFWYCVDVEFVEKFKHLVTLEQMKADSKLDGMRVRERGSRLSVQPVSPEHYERVLTLSREG